MSEAEFILWRVTAPHYTAGLVVRRSDSVVVEAAPILSWAHGKRWKEVRSYLVSKGHHGEIADRW